MAMIDTAHPAPFGAITIYRAANALSSVVYAVKDWVSDKLEARRTADVLSRLSPKMLDDIGLTVADVADLRRAGSMI